MKFRYKVLLINIIILSVGLASALYFMIRQNMDQALENRINNAIEENNVLQSAVEFNLLDVNDNKKSSYSAALKNNSDMITLSMFANRSDVFIIYDNAMVYTNSDSAYDEPFELAARTSPGKKNYIITHEDNEYYIYVSSCSLIASATLNIISKSNISDTYRMLGQQMNFYSVILLLTIIVGSVLIYLFGMLLTNPLERLNQVAKDFGKGDFSARADIKTNDEVGDLALSYNQMADSVSGHVDELNDMIERQNQFIGDFTHEIKTPMTSIIGYADTIRSIELPREKQISSASYIFSEGRRLEKMSSKLFDLIYLKERDLKFNRFPVSGLAEQVEYGISPALEAKNITLKTDFEKITLLGDIDLLTSAFINLIDNARKASDAGSTIEFNGKMQNAKYLITVKDSGMGIPPEHLEHIRDAFYMVDKSRSRKEGGAGLGLSLANIIFTRHDAVMLIESTPGQGTNITVVFPLETQEEVNDEK
ncbi:MAG: HAMP domain-containing histidine kinase [Lachnospiraceae bacterium]|nr:HAMP domain-containing histidine kinase [Lachnospiraceae bacterium]